jgi:hypothetical protein
MFRYAVPHLVRSVNALQGEARGPGHYHADIAVDQSGRWRYRWSAGDSGDEGQFEVERSAFVCVT